MEPEGRAPVRLAVEGDIAAHLFYQFLSDHQPQAGPPVAAGNTGVRLTECLEQTRLIALRYADTGIADLHLNLHLVITERPLFDKNVDIAALGKLDRVTDQIGDDLLQAQRIANDVIRHVVFDIERQLQPLIV